MATEVHLSEALDILRDHFGARLTTGGKQEGYQLMVETLQERLELPRPEAERLIEALERFQIICWMEGRPSMGSGPHAATPFNEAWGMDHAVGPAIAPDTPVGSGYWQLTRGRA